MITFTDVFGQTLFGLYVLASIVQWVVWWGVFGKLGRWTLDVGQSPSPITHHPSPIDQSTNHQLPVTSHQLPVTSHQSPITIIICARNEAENLRRHLPTVVAQQFDADWELLVVDDASEDETPAVLQFFQEKNPGRMRVLRIPQKTSSGKKHALSQGITAAKYDHLLCTDADCEPASPYWLAHMAIMLSAKPETEIVLGYGPMKAVHSNDSKSSDEHLNLWSRYETAFVAAQYFSFTLAGMPYMGVGRNLAFKRQIFEKAGGFAAHAQLPSGDDDLLVNATANARNTTICLVPESFVYSEAPKNWSVWFRQKQRHLSAGSIYQWSHKVALAMVALSQTGFYFLFIVLILAGFNPMAVVGIFLLRLLSVQFIFGKILRVLHETGMRWRVPLFDALMAVYYGTVVPWILIRKKKAGWN